MSDSKAGPEREVVFRVVVLRGDLGPGPKIYSFLFLLFHHP